jgi:predicted AlkP superfamily pyrophosphatase or phosphodiesterase
VYPHNKDDTEAIKEVMDRQSTGKNYTVYLKNEIPARFHYQNNARIPAILLLADLGWIFGAAWKIGGMHGYDPQEPDMHAIFAGYGPSFPRGKKIKAVGNVEVNEFVCGLVGVVPRRGNGTGLLKKLIDI